MAKTTRDFAEVIRAELAADRELAMMVDEEKLHADVATQILHLRTEAKWTQKELADRVGTKQSVISRIEDADYYGHSLKLLHRIAYAFDKRVVVVFCPAESVNEVLRYVAAGATNTVANLQQDSFMSLVGATYILPMGAMIPALANVSPSVSYMPPGVEIASLPQNQGTSLVPYDTGR